MGTNDVDNKCSFDAIISDFGNLIGIVSKKYQKINIIKSSIIPRPRDYDDTDTFTWRINLYLLDHMSKPYNFKFIKSCRPFVFGGKVRDNFMLKKTVAYT